LPHGLLHTFNTILYENEFQNPQIFQQTISLFPEQSTLLCCCYQPPLFTQYLCSQHASQWLAEICEADPRVYTIYRKLPVLTLENTTKLVIQYLFSYRHPCVALQKIDGNIKITRCTCQARIDGKCAHVAALLYLIEDVSLDYIPQMTKPCTSTKQKWDDLSGTHIPKNPQPVQEADYGKKLKFDKYFAFDPRPPHLRKTTQEEINSFHISHQAMANPPFNSLDPMNPPGTPNWLASFKIYYKEYDISDERKVQLCQLRKFFLANLEEDSATYHDDPLSTNSGYHITGSEDQAGSDLWFRARAVRVTASNMLDFTKNPNSVIRKNLWNEQPNLSHVAAIRWGRDHEKDALAKYQQYQGTFVDTCGLFVSRKFPFLGASPDGLVLEKNCLIEIKCPWMMRETTPDNIESLKKEQQKSHFAEKIDGEMKLKRNHKYYVQVMAQMYVTGYKKTHFVT
jgi:hypothetical protein